MDGLSSMIEYVPHQRGATFELDLIVIKELLINANPDSIASSLRCVASQYPQ